MKNPSWFSSVGLLAGCIALGACDGASDSSSGSLPTPPPVPGTGQQAQSLPADHPPTSPSGHGADSPASGPASLPSGHSTSSVAVDLETLFAVPKAKGGVLARLDGRPITEKDIENELRQVQVELSAAHAGQSFNYSRNEIIVAAFDRVVSRMVRRMLAEDLKVKPDPREVDAWLKALDERIKANPSFGVFLERAGKTKAERKKDAEDRALRKAIERKLRERVLDKTDAQTKKYYEEHKSEFKQLAGKEAWRIFLKAPRGMVQRDRDAVKSRAEELAAQAKRSPKSFENLAKSHSEGGNAAQGGYLGFISKNSMTKDLEDQIFAAKPDTVLPVYEDATGYYVYKVGRERTERQVPFEEVKLEIAERAMRPVIDAEMNKELIRMREARKLELYPEELKDIDPNRVGLPTAH